MALCNRSVCFLAYAVMSKPLIKFNTVLNVVLGFFNKFLSSLLRCLAKETKGVDISILFNALGAYLH